LKGFACSVVVNSWIVLGVKFARFVGWVGRLRMVLTWEGVSYHEGKSKGESNDCRTSRIAFWTPSGTDSVRPWASYFLSREFIWASTSMLLKGWLPLSII
jgi:hypothetical protein